MAYQLSGTEVISDDGTMVFDKYDVATCKVIGKQMFHSGTGSWLEYQAGTAYTLFDYNHYQNSGPGYLANQIWYDKEFHIFGSGNIRLEFRGRKTNGNQLQYRIFSNDSKKTDILTNNVTDYAIFSSTFEHQPGRIRLQFLGDVGNIKLKTSGYKPLWYIKNVVE